MFKESPDYKLMGIKDRTKMYTKKGKRKTEYFNRQIRQSKSEPEVVGSYRKYSNIY